MYNFRFLIFYIFVLWTGYDAIWRAYYFSLRELINLAAEVEWSLTVNPVLQVSAEEEALDLCGSLLVFKHTESQDNARVESLMMDFLKTTTGL